MSWLSVTTRRSSSSERIVELHAAFRPQLSLSTASSLRRAARRLEQILEIDRVLTRYGVLDGRMRLLEECLAWIDREWDRHASLQGEIARGK
jgi:hypothetical protein